MIEFGTLNSKRRDPWVVAQLQALPAGGRLLDAGAGQQPYRSFCGHLCYVPQDFAQYDGRGDGQGLQTGAWDHGQLAIVSDITAIPEPDASFDAILCTEVLEHVPDPVTALAELTRLLKENGLLIITVPFVSLTHFAPYHFCTGFNRYFFEHHFSPLGLEIQVLEANGDYHELVAQELHRVQGRLAAQRQSWWQKLTGLWTAYCVNHVIHKLAAMPEVPSTRALGCFGWHVVARKTLRNGHDG